MMVPLPARRSTVVFAHPLPLAATLFAALFAATLAHAAPPGATAPAPTGGVVLPAGPATTSPLAPTEGPHNSAGTPPAPKAGAGPALPGGKNDKSPIDIKADNAIEWHQDQKAYVARGNASAVRGTSTVYADVLTAYYRETKEKGSDVYRMTAEGHVRIITPTQQIFGEHGVYDNDKQVGVITGNNLKLITATDVVVARDSLEYYDATKLAVARGDAIAVRNQNRMRADTLVSLFKEDASGSLIMDRLDGIGHVIITTPSDVALCERVMYSAATDISVLVGGVKITRGEDQVNGDSAEMNMKTHVNRVLSGGQRVEGLLQPQDQNAAKPGADHKAHPTAPPAPAMSSGSATPRPTELRP